MKHSEKELEKYIRKAPLREIINDIVDNGIKIDDNKYPKYKTLKVLRQIILDYQDLVPGEEPDLDDMTEAVDIDINETLVEESKESVKEEPKYPNEPDWELIKSIDVSDRWSPEGRRKIVRAIFLELLHREPDHIGMNTFSEHIESGMSIANLRDAIKRSTEYKRKHKI